MWYFTENYRSTQTILNTAQKLIKYNSERLTNNFDFINKNLQAANKNLLEINIPISIIEYKNPAEEMMDICLQIEELIFQKKLILLKSLYYIKKINLVKI